MTAGLADELSIKNQASATDTIILPPPSVDNDPPPPPPVTLLPALRAAGVARLDRVAVIDADVDPDGCMAPPLAARHDDLGVPVLADALREHGVAVTIVSSAAADTIDTTAQRRLAGVKGNYSLAYDQGPRRWFATRAELVACAHVDPEENSTRRPHAALAAVLAGIHQDAVLAVTESSAESKGPRWNIIEGELSSDGRSLDEATSFATIAATLVLADGRVAWSGKADAQGALHPPLDAEAIARLRTFMEAFLRRMQTYREAHPGADKPPPDLDEAAFNAVTSGDLAHAPAGTTLGPSASATLRAAANRLLVGTPATARAVPAR